MEARETIKTVAENWSSGPRPPPLPELTLHYFSHQIHVSVHTCTVTYQACLRHGAVLSDEAEFIWRIYSTSSFRLHHYTTPPHLWSNHRLARPKRSDTMLRPLGNSTVLPAAEWHAEPQTRGTFSILSSCLITMSLCIWTSLHLNLPEHKKEQLLKYHKLAWMIAGLVAPEMVVWNAWEQRKDMKLLSELMQEKGFMPLGPTLWRRVRNTLAEVWQWTLICLLLKAKDWPELAEPAPYRQYNGRIHPWTDVHSWFVVMGGLSFEDSAEEDQQFMPENRQRVNITLEGFQYMLEMRDRLIPDISREYIQDKSKSDKLAKLLTCWQAGYFCVQCLYRLSQQLSVTLLELNVFAHALCALALFAIWSDKPRDVCESTLIVGEDAMNLCALLCLQAVGGNEHCAGYKIETSPGHPDRTLEIFRPTSFSCLIRRLTPPLYGAFRKHNLKVLETHWVIKRNMAPTDSFVTLVALDWRDLRRLQRVSRFIQRESSRSLGPVCIHPTDMPDLAELHSIARTRNLRLDTIWHLNFMTENRPLPYDVDRFAWFAAGVTCAGMFYGGLHSIAWKTPFGSRTELLLWRAACVSIMAAGLFCVLVAACCRPFFKFCKSFPKSRTWLDDGRARQICANRNLQPGLIYKAMIWARQPWDKQILGFIVKSAVLWYGCCRVFIVVESFIMLAHIPDQALQVPTWSAYIPHIV
jgi:hypothetical protein